MVATPRGNKMCSLLALYMYRHCVTLDSNLLFLANADVFHRSFSLPVSLKSVSFYCWQNAQEFGSGLLRMD